MQRLTPIVMFAALAAAGCDSWLGRYDQMTVDIDPRDGELTGTTDGVSPDAGQGGAEDGGEGDGTGDDADGGTTDDAGDGGTADDADDDGGDDSTDPVDDDAPVIAALTDVVTNVQFSKTATVTDASPISLQWTMTAGPGVLTFGSDTAATTTISASVDGTYTVQVTATDAGSLSSSRTFQLTWDTDDPDNLTAFTGQNGVSAATVDLSWTIPGSAADFATLTLRRIVGGAAPVDCTDGDLAATFHAPFVAGAVAYTDDTDEADQTFSYRICIVDEAGNLTSDASETATGFVSKAHLMFATSGVTNGGLDGGGGDARDRADAICQAFGNGSSLGLINEEARWRAVLSVDAQDAVDRLSVWGIVYASDGATDIAASEAQLWSSLLQNSVFNDEENLVGPATVWTGTAANGTSTGANCNNWTEVTNADTGTIGDTNATDGTWVQIVAAQDCDNATSGLYCISQYDTQPLANVTAVAGTASGGTIDVTVELPASLLGYEEIRIRGAAGGAAPAPGCAAGTDVATIADPAHADFTRTHQGLTPGDPYSYRVCVLDAGGKVVDEMTVTSVPASL